MLEQGELVVRPDALAQIVEQLDHGPGLLGRVFNGVGQVIDGGPPIATDARFPIDGLPMNPVARALPRDFIETGVSTLDLMNSLVRGQKLPIFSGGGLPHDRIAVEIAVGGMVAAAHPGRKRGRLPVRPVHGPGQAGAEPRWPTRATCRPAPT